MYSPSPRGGLRLGEKLHARTKYLTYQAKGGDYGRACPQPVTVFYRFPTATKHFPYSSSNWAAYSSGFEAEPVP